MRFTEETRVGTLAMRIGRGALAVLVALAVLGAGIGAGALAASDDTCTPAGEATTVTTADPATSTDGAAATDPDGTPPETCPQAPAEQTTATQATTAVTTITEPAATTPDPPVVPATPATPATLELPASPATPATPAAESSPAAVTPPAAPPAARIDTPELRTRTVRPPKREKSRARRPRSEVPRSLVFEPVSVDWSEISPIAPPLFAADAQASFPGPAFLLPIYRAAATQYNVPWEILAAINEIETGFGRNLSTSSAGAVGWMQFMPGTWSQWGVDANGDGVKNPGDPVDAIFAAARYLKASGSVQDMGKALWAYNHAGWYVRRVLDRALEFGLIPIDLLTALTERGREDAGAIRRATGERGYLAQHVQVRMIGQVLLLDDQSLRRWVLADERVELYECGRIDVMTGIVDRRVLETLEFLAYRKLRPTATSLRCGHGYYTKSGTVSEHSSGNAVDIAAINDTRISTANQGRGSITDRAVRRLLRLQGGMRPHQIISLMSYDGAPNTLAMGDHDDHIHVGFAPIREFADR